MANAGAFESGYQQGYGVLQHNRDRKEWLSDQDHAIKREEYLKDLDSYRDQIKTLKDNPQYADQVKKLTDLAAQREYDLHQLYRPDKAPGRLQQDWHYLRERIHGIKQPQSPAAPSTATPQVSQTPQDGVAPTTLPGMQGVSGTPTPEQVALGGASASPVAIPEMPAYKQASVGTPVPKGATPTMAVAKPRGLVEAGNIPIWNRPSIHNDDGTHSSELSISIGDDKGNQILIPLIVNGRFLTPDGKMPPGPIPHNAQEWEKASPEWKALKMKAEQHYKQTGEHLGKFGGPTAEDDVDAYAQVLHNRGSVAAPKPETTGLQAPPPVSWGKAQLLKKQAAAMQKAQQEANALVAGGGMSAEQEAVAKVGAEYAALQAKLKAIDSNTMLTPEEKEEQRRLAVGGSGKNVSENIKTFTLKLKDGREIPVMKDMRGNSPVMYLNNTPVPNEVLQDATFAAKPSKPIRGTLVNAKGLGYIQTWVDAYNPSKIVGWQHVTPSRYYQGTTNTRTSTDSLGITTTSSGTTMPANSAPVDIDLSGVKELPSEFNGEELPSENTTPPSNGSPNNQTPSASPPPSVAKPTTGGTAPKKTATPAQLRAQIPAPPNSGKPVGNALFDSLVNSLLSGKTAPSEIKGRDKDAVMARASQVDPTFDPSKADSDYKYANDISTRNLLNYLNSLTGKNGNGGNLSELVKESDKIDRTEFPPLNDKIAWAKLNTGSKEIASYYTTITEVSDQVAKILQGGGSGSGTSDAKLRQAQELFDKGFTKDQIRGVADSLKELLSNRKESIIGDNYYLTRWYKPKPEHFVYAKGPDGKIKRRHADDNSPLPAGYTMMPEGWTPNGTAGAAAAK